MSEPFSPGWLLIAHSPSPVCSASKTSEAMNSCCRAPDNAGHLMRLNVTARAFLFPNQSKELWGLECVSQPFAIPWKTKKSWCLCPEYWAWDAEVGYYPAQQRKAGVLRHVGGELFATQHQASVHTGPPTGRAVSMGLEGSSIIKCYLFSCMNTQSSYLNLTIHFCALAFHVLFVKLLVFFKKQWNSIKQIIQE